MINVNHDNIPLYGEDEDIIYFDDWLKNLSVYEKSYEEITNYFICELGYHEEVLDDAIDNLKEQFYDYCDEYGYYGEEV